MEGGKEGRWERERGVGEEERTERENMNEHH